MIHFQLRNWSQNKSTWVVYTFLCFAFVSLVCSGFFCLKLGTTLFLSFSSFVWCRLWSSIRMEAQPLLHVCWDVAPSLLQEVSWTHGGGAGACWRTRPSCGSAPSRRPWSQAGSTKKAEECQRFPAATGSAAGLCFENPSSCTLRMIVRKSWRGLLTSEGQSECKNKSLWSLVFTLNQ